MSADRDWSTIKHFKRHEFVKDPDLISWDVVMLLDEMRDAAEAPIVIHVAWDDEGHVPDSSHYGLRGGMATAVDCHVEGMSLLDQWLLAEKLPWASIGVYPHWKTPGLHLDLRRLGRDHPRLGKRWWRDERGIYHPLDRTLLKRLLLMPAA
jgi:hypothetical protein